MSDYPLVAPRVFCDAADNRRMERQNQPYPIIDCADGHT